MDKKFFQVSYTRSYIVQAESEAQADMQALDRLAQDYSGIDNDFIRDCEIDIDELSPSEVEDKILSGEE